MRTDDEEVRDVNRSCNVPVKSKLQHPPPPPPGIWSFGKLLFFSSSLFQCWKAVQMPLPPWEIYQIRNCLHGGRVPRQTRLLGKPSYPGRANLYVSLENALKRSHARQGSLPAQDTLLTCSGHLARWDSFLPCERFVPRYGYPGFLRWDVPWGHGGARWISS